MGYDKDSKLGISEEKPADGSHQHDFETEDKKCKICGKTIEELLDV